MTCFIFGNLKAKPPFLKRLPSFHNYIFQKVDRSKYVCAAFHQDQSIINRGHITPCYETVFIMQIYSLDTNYGISHMLRACGYLKALFFIYNSDKFGRIQLLSVCRRCSNYIFILDLTPDFNELGNDNCKTRRETFEFSDFVRFILEDLR